MGGFSLRKMVGMICIECSQHISVWDKSYLDDNGTPKYYTETKTKDYIDRFPLCGPYCSLKHFQKTTGKNNEN